MKPIKKRRGTARGIMNPIIVEESLFPVNKFTLDFAKPSRKFFVLALKASLFLLSMNPLFRIKP